MKLTKLSLAAIMALGFTSAAMADVDVQFGGQAVLYYQTFDKDAKDAPDMFDKEVSQGNVGLQIRSKADLGNDFQAGVTVNIISTLGLENNVVGDVMQYTSNYVDKLANNAGRALLVDKGTEDLDLGGYWVPEAYVAKTFGNTTVKLGRQYLNTPLAFSEGWNVFKNSFEAAVLVNKDLPDTTVVLAMVNKGNGNGVGLLKAPAMDEFYAINVGALSTNILEAEDPEDVKIAYSKDGAVYALGIMNNSIENLNLDIWGYNLTSTVTALWADVNYKVNAGEFPLTIALQGAQLDISDDDLEDIADANDYDDKTTMWGVKVGTNVQDWGLSVAYNSVNDGLVPVQNVSTGVKTKLFVQQILNQDAIKQDADTWQLKVVTPEFSGVKVIAQYSMTDAGDKNRNQSYKEKGNDLNELDLIAKTKVAGINLLAAFVVQDYDEEVGSASEHDSKDQNMLRVVARYSF